MGATEIAANAIKAAAPIAVHSEGMTATAWTVLSVGATILIAIITGYFKFRPTMTKLANDADGSLRGDLLKRIALLEARAQMDREECDRRLDAQQRKLDAIFAQFFTYQIEVAHHLSDEAARIAQTQAAKVMSVMRQPVESFMEPKASAGLDRLVEQLDERA